MFQYRQVRVRLRAGDSVREIARSGLMGRDKLGELRAVAEHQGWLAAQGELPGDEAIAAALGESQRASSVNGIPIFPSWGLLDADDIPAQP